MLQWKQNSQGKSALMIDGARRIGQIFLPLGGFLTCLFLGWYVPKQIVQDEFTNWGTLKGRLFGIYLFLIKFVCPVLIFLVFLNQFGVFG